MSKQYISTGLNMLDRVYYNNIERGIQLGGIPMYGYAGMRLWTDSIVYGARVGKDFFDIYGEWYERFGADPNDPIVVSDTTPYCDIFYNDNHEVQNSVFFTGNFDDAAFWRPHGEDFDRWIGPETKGLYTCCSAIDSMWENIFRLKEKYNFKIMWEPNYASTFGDRKEQTEVFCKRIEMASFNVEEGCRIFQLETEQQLLDHLCSLNMELILLRCGHRGLYVIFDNRAVMIPSVITPPPFEVIDTTGCGNSSTAGACVAYCEGHDPIMCGIMANISANYNLRQKGTYPAFTPEEIEFARNWAEQLYQNFKL